MHVDEYRFFITRIQELEAEVTGLDRTIERERKSATELKKAFENAEAARLRERAEYQVRVDQLSGELRRYKRKPYYPGVIFGGGPSWHDGGRSMQFIGGLGWKIDIF